MGGKMKDPGNEVDVDLSKGKPPLNLLVRTPGAIFYQPVICYVGLPPYLPACLPTWLSICLPGCLFVRLSMCESVCLSLLPYLSVCLFAYLSVVSVCLSLSVYRQSISLLPLLINLVSADNVSYWYINVYLFLNFPDNSLSSARLPLSFL